MPNKTFYKITLKN